jgi:hypothetical protein
MGILARRSIHHSGKFSRVLTLPAKMKMGEEATLAATRLVLVDPRGEIDPEVLLKLLEAIESQIWSWINENKGSRNQVDLVVSDVGGF